MHFILLGTISRKLGYESMFFGEHAQNPGHDFWKNLLVFMIYFAVSAFHTPGHYIQKPGIWVHVFWRTCPESWAWFLKKFASSHSRPCGKNQAPDVDLISKKKEFRYAILNTGFYEKTVSTQFYLPRNLGMLARNWNMIIGHMSKNTGNIPMFPDMLDRFLEQQLL